MAVSQATAFSTSSKLNRPSTGAADLGEDCGEDCGEDSGEDSGELFGAISFLKSLILS